MNKPMLGLEVRHKPTVSVVMSVYNGEKYLRESVESILHQTYMDFEFIIVNDGSVDGTKEILEYYVDERIVLLHQENIGLTKSLNRGIAVARGKYIARQDADDISKPLRLEKQVAFLEKNPDVGLLGTNFTFIDDNGKLLHNSYLPLDNENLQNRLARICTHCHTSVMIRKEALDKVGGYRDFFKYAQDYDLWLRISEKYKIRNLSSFLVSYRETREAISSEKILLQSLYAGVAAEMAHQRRTAGIDDIEKGNEPVFPSVRALSEELQHKLADYYAKNPQEFAEILLTRNKEDDTDFLLERIIESGRKKKTMYKLLKSKSWRLIKSLRPMIASVREW